MGVGLDVGVGVGVTVGVGVAVGVDVGCGVGEGVVVGDGALGVWFIIPANLDVGDTFFDRNAPPPGIFTIQSVEEMTYAGALRAVSFSPSYFEEYKRWDKITGVFVEGLGIYENYTIHTIAQNTNMWAPQIIGIDSTIFYIIVSVIILLILLTITIIILKRRKKHDIT